MDVRTAIKKYADAPITRHLMLEILSHYKRPNDKISELIKGGFLIAVKRGIYLPGPKIELPALDPFLVANYLRGPSYVSSDTALSYWGLIPERTYEVSSATVKLSTIYKTPIGRFSYQHLPLPYYSFGIKSIAIAPKQVVLIASPEKALTDKIVLTPAINLRSVKQTEQFLLEDLRLDERKLKTLNMEAIQLWITDAPKSSSLSMLIKTLQER